jgi:hypothetical protein
MTGPNMHIRGRGYGCTGAIWLRCLGPEKHRRRRSRGAGWLGARTFPGNPYDDQILSAVLEQATNLTRDISVKLRQAVEPAIGHLKSDHRLQRCWLQGALGDALHAVSAASIPS